MAVAKFARLTFWAVGLMVGAGIYGTISEIVKISDSWAPAMFVTASFVMLLNGFALAGVVRKHPHAGSILAVVQQTLHPWVAISFEVLRLAEGFAALCVTSKLTARFAWGLAQGSSVEPPMTVELAMLAAVAFVVHHGFDWAMDFGNIGTLIEVGGLILVIGAGLVVTPADMPLLDPKLQGPGIRSASVSVAMIVFAFGGVQGVLDVAGEVPAAERWVLPWAIVSSIAVTGLLYVCVCYAALSMVGVEGLTSREAVSPLGMVLERVGFPLGTETALALVSLVSVGNTCTGIFTFVSRIALSLGSHATGRAQGVSPPAVYTLLVFGSTLTGRYFDVFALAGRIGVMLLVTFAVLDYAFVATIAQTKVERIIGVTAFSASCVLVLVDQLV